MPASSTAANSELRMLPLPMRSEATRGAVSIRLANLPSSPRWTTRRLKLALSAAQRAVRRSRLWPSVASTVTVRPGAPSTFGRASGSVRRKAAAAGSLTPRRASSDSMLSEERTASAVNRLKR